MAKIRWRPQDIEEMRKEIERYNRKVRRLAKKGFESDLFNISKPFKEIQKDITTRGEYKDYLAHLRNLTEKGSEYQYTPAKEKGITISKGEVAELDRMVKIINSDRRKRAKEYEKRTGAKVKNLPQQDIQRLTLKPKQSATKKIATMDYGGLNKMNFEKFTESVQTQSDKDYIDNRYQINKQRYVEQMPNRLGIYTYDIMDRIDKIPDKDFYYLQIEYPELSYEFMYNDPLTPSEKAEYIESILDELGY